MMRGMGRCGFFTLFNRHVTSGSLSALVSGVHCYDRNEGHAVTREEELAESDHVSYLYNYIYRPYTPFG